MHHQIPRNYPVTLPPGHPPFSDQVIEDHFHHFLPPDPAPPAPPVSPVPLIDTHFFETRWAPSSRM